MGLGSALAGTCRNVWKRFGVKVEVHRRRQKPSYETHRFDYQRRFVDFGLEPGASVLDIGSGGDPFPSASILVERFLDPVYRTDKLVTDAKPLVLADIVQLPFPDDTFDFAYSAHVLEVVDDPIAASRELIRVAKRGYIETPTFGKDMLFAWARGFQKWHVVGIDSHLCFFEYSDRELSGVDSTVWRKLIRGNWQHPLQDMFWENQDIFNVMFLWERSFSVFVFRLDGSVRTLNVPDVTADASSDLAPVRAESK